MNHKSTDMFLVFNRTLPSSTKCTMISNCGLKGTVSREKCLCEAVKRLQFLYCCLPSYFKYKIVIYIWADCRCFFFIRAGHSTTQLRQRDHVSGPQKYSLRLLHLDIKNLKLFTCFRVKETLSRYSFCEAKQVSRAQL